MSMQLLFTYCVITLWSMIKTKLHEQLKLNPPTTNWFLKKSTGVFCSFALNSKHRYVPNDKLSEFVETAAKLIYKN